MSLLGLWNGLVRAPRPAGNPVQAWLDAANLPWRSTRGDLTARFGIHTDNPYKWDIVPLEIRRPPLDGMLWPLGFQAFARYNTALPPERLSTHLWIADDADANIRHAAAQLARPLGTRRIEDHYNTRQVEWRCGLASVTLTVWPPSMQSGPKLTNAAHTRDKRLRTACALTVQTGWRPPLTPPERGWLDAFVPMGRTTNWTSANPRAEFGHGLFAETLIEFMRDPPADLARFRGAFGLAAGGEALIACEDALYLIALVQIAGFKVERTLPANGGGGSVLSACCTTGYAACPTKDVPIARGARADDLNDIAATLATAAGKPLKLGSYEYDV